MKSLLSDRFSPFIETSSYFVTKLRTESNRKLSLVNFQWTKILYQNNFNYVSVNWKHQHPHGQPPGHLPFLKTIVQIPPYPAQKAVQMSHTRVHSGDQMPPSQGHSTGTYLTEERQKRPQFSNKIFRNTANNSHSI